MLKRAAKVKFYLDCDPATAWNSILAGRSDPTAFVLTKKPEKGLPQEQYLVAEIIAVQPGQLCAYRIRGAEYDTEWRAELSRHGDETRLTVSEIYYFNTMWFWLLSFFLYPHKQALECQVSTMIAPLRQSLEKKRGRIA